MYPAKTAASAASLVHLFESLCAITAVLVPAVCSAFSGLAMAASQLPKPAAAVAAAHVIVQLL